MVSWKWDPLDGGCYCRAEGRTERREEPLSTSFIRFTMVETRLFLKRSVLSRMVVMKLVPCHSLWRLKGGEDGTVAGVCEKLSSKSKQQSTVFVSQWLESKAV